MSATAGFLPAVCGAPSTPDTWLSLPALHPALLVPLVVMAAATALVPAGLPRLRWAGASAVAALLFLSPLCTLAVALFSARTVQHLALVLGAAPLAALALRKTRLPRGLAPGPAALLFLALLVAWHIPSVYDPALGWPLAYAGLNAALFAGAVLFWAMLDRIGLPAALAALGALMAAMAGIGAILLLAPDPLYARHALAPLAWGLSPLEDQQWAGILMWAGAMPATLLAGLPFLARHVGPPPALMPRFPAWRG